MLQEEFERMTGCHEADVYKQANETYMALPHLTKADFCLLWSMFDGQLLEFTQVRGIADTVAPAPRLLRELDERLYSKAKAVRAELAKPENWTERTRRAARKAVKYADEQNRNEQEVEA